jgi:drug/metabolite transporter (DMT)-like permease
MLIGVVASFLGAGCFAISTMLVKLEAPRLAVLAHNAYRAIVASLVMAVLFLLTHAPGDLARLPPPGLAAAFASLLCGPVIGDSLNYRAMLLIGMGRAFPIASTYPLVTLLVAAALLGEPIGLGHVAGALAVLAGVTLVALPANLRDQPVLDRRANAIGVGLALGASLLWAGSNAFIKIALESMDVITLNAVRMPVSALLLGLLLRGAPPPPPWRLPRRTLAAVATTGLLSASLGSLLTMVAVQHLGAGRAAVLGSTAPLLGAPLSVLVLKERISHRLLLGTLLTVAGVALVVL